jgi:hypothetical protein
LIKKSLKNAQTPENISSLINSIAYISELVNDEVFGDYDDKSTIRSTPRGSIRSNFN